MGLPILRVLGQVWSLFGSVITRAAVEAYHSAAKENRAAGIVGGREAAATQMTTKEALEILNVEAKNVKKLSDKELARAEENYKKYFEDNAPEADGPGGSAYLQGKVLAAYQHIRNSANKA